MEAKVSSIFGLNAKKPFILCLSIFRPKIRKTRGAIRAMKRDALTFEETKIKLKLWKILKLLESSREGEREGGGEKEKDSHEARK